MCSKLSPSREYHFECPLVNEKSVSLTLCVLNRMRSTQRLLRTASRPCFALCPRDTAGIKSLRVHRERVGQAVARRRVDLFRTAAFDAIHCLRDNRLIRVDPETFDYDAVLRLAERAFWIASGLPAKHGRYWVRVINKDRAGFPSLRTAALLSGTLLPLHVMIYARPRAGDAAVPQAEIEKRLVSFKIADSSLNAAWRFLPPDAGIQEMASTAACYGYTISVFIDESSLDAPQ